MGGAGGQDGVGGDAAHAVGSQEKERRALRLDRAREAEPGGVGHEAGAAGGEAEVRDDERKAGREQHLRGGERFLDAAGTHPEEELQIHARRGRALGIQVLSRIHQRRGLSGRGDGSERGQGDRETTARAAAGELDELAPRQAAGKQAIERIEAGRQALLRLPAPRKVRRDRQAGAQAGQEASRLLRVREAFLQDRLEREGLR